MKMSNYEVTWLNIIRDAVADYLKDTNSTVTSLATAKSLVKPIEDVLPHIALGKKFTVLIEETKNPFIMRICPDMKELDAKSEQLINILDDPKSKNEDLVREWCEIQHWFVEIDSKILAKGGRLCVDDGNQFVALLCHEIGHVMNENPIHLIYNYRMNVQQFNKFEKMLVSRNPVIRKLFLPMYTHTLQFKVLVRNHSVGLEKEIAADGYVPEEYRGDLLIYMQNHILTDPTSRNYAVMDEEKFNNEQQTAVQFSRDAIDLLKKRSDILKKQLRAQTLSPESDTYTKNLMDFISQSVMGYNPLLDETDIITESRLTRVLDSEYKYCMEQTSAVLESTHVTGRDLDLLRIQIDNCSTVEEKMYLIHTIYDYREILCNQEAKRIKKAKNPDKAIPDPIVEKQLVQLDELRLDLMAKRVTDVGDKLELYVKYPKGYEG